MLRHRGYTTWLLKSAILNPMIFIVCKDGRNKDDLQTKFSEMVFELHKVTMATSGRDIRSLYNEWPKFITMDRVSDSIRGHDQFIPVIFDNSCYYD